MFPLQRGVAILGVCVRGEGAAVPPDFPRTARACARARACAVPCRARGPGPGRAGSGRHWGPGTPGHICFQKNGKSFTRGHLKGPNENADFFLTGQACRSSPWPQIVEIRTFFHKYCSPSFGVGIPKLGFGARSARPAPDNPRLDAALGGRPEAPGAPGGPWGG